MRTRATTMLTMLLLVGAALFAVFCSGGGGGSPTEPAPPGVATVKVVDNAFDPRSITVQPGTTVRWTMQGSSPDHTVTALDGSFNSGFAFKNRGDVFEHTFTAADQGRTFEYSCETHSVCCDMKGSVRVGENAPPPRPGY